MTQFQKQVLDLVEKGYSHSEIVKELKCPKSSVSSVFKSLNIKPKKCLTENTVNHNYFDEINTDTKAYFLGFLIADGSISDRKREKGRFSFDIQEEDSHLLFKLKEELNSKNPVQFKICTSGAKNRKPQVNFRWTSVHMMEVLKNKYNITPRKTKDITFQLPFDNIPEKHWGALLRGFIDGDGCFEQHKGVFTPTVIGTSKVWLLQIADIIKKKTDLKYKIYENQGKTCVYYTMRFTAGGVNKVEKITKLREFLYKDVSICLERKKNKIDTYLEYRANQVRVKGIWRCNA